VYEAAGRAGASSTCTSRWTPRTDLDDEQRELLVDWLKCARSHSARHRMPRIPLQAALSAELSMGPGRTTHRTRGPARPPTRLIVRSHLTHLTHLTVRHRRARPGADGCGAMVFVADPRLRRSRTPTSGTCSTCCDSVPASWWRCPTAPVGGRRAGWPPAPPPGISPRRRDRTAGARRSGPECAPGRSRGDVAFTPTKGDRRKGGPEADRTGGRPCRTAPGGPVGRPVEGIEATGR